MKERENVIELFEIYGDLFTKKQQNIFKKYFYEDLSLSEISENINVSRSYISKSLQQIIFKLKFYESKLKIYNKTKKIINEIDKLDISKKIIEIIKE